MSTVYSNIMSDCVLYEDEDLKTQLHKANETISKQQQIIDDLRESMSEGMSLYGIAAVYWLGVVDNEEEKKRTSPCTDGLSTDNETKATPLSTVDTSLSKQEQEQLSISSSGQDEETIAGEVLPSVYMMSEYNYLYLYRNLKLNLLIKTCL